MNGEDSQYLVERPQDTGTCARMLRGPPCVSPQSAASSWSITSRCHVVP